MPDVQSVANGAHAASGNKYLMRRCHVLSGLQLLLTRRPDKALVRIRQSMPDATLHVLSGLQLLLTRRPDQALVPHPAMNA
ncbi:hypothetical protein ACNKHM_11285 [Shigella sonnei]